MVLQDDVKIIANKKIVLKVLSDEMEHSSDEIKSRINIEGVDIVKKSSLLRTAIYQLRSNNINIYSRNRGIYQLKNREKTENIPTLNGFVTLMPEATISPSYVYIHSDGNLVLNGKLNKEIESRHIEIMIIAF